MVMVQPMGAFPQEPPRRKTSALAVVAFVISLLFFLPFVPVIGSILGIIAVARNRPDLGGKGLAIAAIPVGIVTALLLQGMMAAIAIPSFIKYVRKSKTVEATQGLHRLVAGAREHARAERHDESGRPLPGLLPLGRTEWVPATPCCQQPSAPRCSPTPADWAAEPWRSLHFQVAEPHHYQWRYSSDGKTMTAEARGDLDCDGTYSSFKAEGVIAEGGMSFRGPMIENEIE
jgi:type II secretory pathway pseudopilin PulG